MKVHSSRLQLPILKAAQVFRMLADAPRLRILLLLAGEDELSVSALCQAIGQSQPSTSHHLTLLRMTGLVNYRRVGRQNRYYLNSDLVRDLLASVSF